MKIHLKNLDALKSRIKKLKQSLNEFEGLSPSLGLCRDLVAQSLNWDDWNDLYLGHKPPGLLTDRILFTGNWFRDETNKEDAFKKLLVLLQSSFVELTDKHDEAAILSAKVWSYSNSLHYSRPKNPTSYAHAIKDIPSEHFKNNILIDAWTQKEFSEFRNRVLAPKVIHDGGIIFCAPEEAEELMLYFGAKKHHIM